jgi:hypothetical protein
MERAEQEGLDLVEIVPNAEPPVCRLMDFGRFLFDQKKKKSEARKKQKQVQVKEVKFRPGTDIGDYQVKIRNLTRFLNEGDKAKVTTASAVASTPTGSWVSICCDGSRAIWPRSARWSSSRRWKDGRWSWCWGRGRSNPLPAPAPAGDPDTAGRRGKADNKSAGIAAIQAAAAG